MMYLRRTEESSTSKPSLIRLIGECDGTGGHAYSNGRFVVRRDRVSCICPRCNFYHEREAGYDEIRELLNGNRWFGIG